MNERVKDALIVGLIAGVFVFYNMFIYTKLPI